MLDAAARLSLLRDMWHFHFYGDVPLALVKDCERTHVEHLGNDLAADRNHSVSERDRRRYAEAYAQPGAMQAAFEYFRAFERDADDFAELGKRPLPLPVLVLAGEKSAEIFWQTRCGRSRQGSSQLIAGSGHWLIAVIPALATFLDLPSP